MKLPTLLLVGSLVANAVLVGTLVFRPSLAPPAFRDFFARGSAGDVSNSSAATESVARKTAATEAHGNLWSALQSDDLPRLVTQLRAAGFPTSSIRAIISSLVDVRYIARMQAFTQPDPDAPFWKPASSLGSDPKRMAEFQQLASERSKLLRDLLGNFAASDDGEITPAQRRRYGDLSASKIATVDRIAADYSEMANLVRIATNNIILPEDRDKLALLDSEKRADLAAILTPQELEDYDMRNSTTTSRLRNTFNLFKASEDEFRIIHRIEQALADKINPPALGGTLPRDFMEQRNAAQEQLKNQLKAALGDERYAEFARSSDREYQLLTQLTDRENLPSGTAMQAYNLRDHLSQESNRIFNDTALTVDQKRAALQSLAQNTRTQLLTTLGAVGDAYVRSASWLASVERGGAVTFTESSTSFRSLPPSGTTRPPPPTGGGGGGRGGGGGF